MEPFIQILNGFSLLSKSARGKGLGDDRGMYERCALFKDLLVDARNDSF